MSSLWYVWNVIAFTDNFKVTEQIFYFVQSLLNVELSRTDYKSASWSFLPQKKEETLLQIQVPTNDSNTTFIHIYKYAHTHAHMHAHKQ